MGYPARLKVSGDIMVRDEKVFEILAILSFCSSLLCILLAGVSKRGCPLPRRSDGGGLFALAGKQMGFPHGSTGEKSPDLGYFFAVLHVEKFGGRKLEKSADPPLEPVFVFRVPFDG